MDLTRERIDPELLELVARLRAFAPPADKGIYSPFLEPGFPALLRRRGAESLVITGAEVMTSWH